MDKSAQRAKLRREEESLLDEIAEHQEEVDLCLIDLARVRRLLTASEQQSSDTPWDDYKKKWLTSAR